MNQLISDYKLFKINKKGIPPKGKILNIDISKKKHLTERPGLYNGDILGCVFSKQTNNNLILDCYKFKFFDIILDKIDPDFSPKMVNVNALIIVKDKENNEYILFIKREKEVYDYPEYWDFPAGFVPYDTSPLDRLNDRIIKDLGSNFAGLTTSEKPLFVVSRLKSYGLYYKMNCSMTKENVDEILSGEIKRGKIKLVKLTELNKFLNSKEKIFPSYLGQIYEK